VAQLQNVKRLKTKTLPTYGAFTGYPCGYEAGFAIYEGLVAFDENMVVYPSLAESWEVSEDGLTWTFHLREGVTFHDGTPFDSEAVRINFERGMDSSRTTTNRALWNPWETVEVIDEYTISISSAEPFAIALNALAHGAGLMVSPAAIAEYEDHPEHYPVGTGPFKLESFEVGMELVLVANEEYWRGYPGADKLIYRYIPEASTRVAALLAGEVDVINAVPPHEALRIGNNPDFAIIQKPGLRVYQLDMMLEREFLKDIRVRQALNYAVSKEAIARGIFLGYAQVADSPLGYDTYGHSQAGDFAYDPDKARELLSDAGWIDTDGDGILDKDGQPFELTIGAGSGKYEQDVNVVQAVGNQLGQIGISVTIENVERSSYTAYLQAPVSQLTWDMALYGFNPSNGSGQYQLEAVYHSNADQMATPDHQNYGRYLNTEVDRLIMEAKRTVDGDDRSALLATAQKIIFNDAVCLWLVVPELIVAHSKDVSNVELWPVWFTVLRSVTK